MGGRGIAGAVAEGWWVVARGVAGRGRVGQGVGKVGAAGSSAAVEQWAAAAEEEGEGATEQDPRLSQSSRLPGSGEGFPAQICGRTAEESRA